MEIPSDDLSNVKPPFRLGITSVVSEIKVGLSFGFRLRFRLGFCFGLWFANVYLALRDF